MENSGKIPLSDDELRQLKALNKAAAELIKEAPDEAIVYADEVIAYMKRVIKSKELFEQVAKAYNTKGIACWHNRNSPEAIEHHTKALEIWRLITDVLGIGRSLIGIGNAYLNIGDFMEALKFFQNALKILEKEGQHEGMASVYNNVGVVYKNLGEYAKAATFYHKALALKEQEGLSDSIANSYNNIGILYLFQKNFDKALEYIRKAEEINKKAENFIRLSDNYNNIALIYSKLREFDEALSYYSKALDITTKLGIKSSEMSLYETIGEINAELRDYEVALKNYFQALELAIETDAKPRIGFIHIQIGQVLMSQEAYHEAEVHFQKGLEISQQTKSKDCIKDAYKNLAELSAIKKNFENAYTYINQYIQLKDELYNEEHTKIINEIQTKYEAEKKDLEIEKLNIEQEHLTIVNKELDLFAGKAAHDLKEPLRTIQGFTELIISHYEDLFDQDGKEYLKLIKEATIRMTGLLTGLLKFTRAGIANVPKEEVNLNDILIHLKHDLQLITQETATQIIVPTPLPIVLATNSGMLQVFQNLITNAIKFKQPDQAPIITIEAEQQKNVHLITITDNGIGIPEDKLEDIFDIFTRLNSRKDFVGSGIGLATCKRIIDSLGGRIWVESSQENGAKFSIEIPYIF